MDESDLADEVVAKRLQKVLDDGLALVIADVVRLAQSYLDYPLHIVIASADGWFVEYLLPAKGQEAIVERVTIDSGGLEFPLTLTVHEYDAARAQWKEPGISAEVPRRKTSRPGNVIQFGRYRPNRKPDLPFKG